MGFRWKKLSNADVLPAGSNLKNLFHAKSLGGYSIFVNADQ